MKKWVLMFLVLVAVPLLAQTNAPIRLAVVSESGNVKTTADVLTAQLSSNGKIQLLERDQIKKVYRELGLSAANRDDLKLGRMLEADGLLVLNVVRTPTGVNLKARLVAVKPGVVLTDLSFPWPLKDTTQWAKSVANHLKVFLPKLAVLAKDAIPISIVNFRAAISAIGEREAERELKLLTIQRLSQEQRLFVLERQGMQLLSREKALEPDESAFWDGSYLLDGVVDQSGYSPKTVTINARLTPPKGGVPLTFEVSGSRTNLTEVVNRLAARVNQQLNVQSTVGEWSAAEEADQYYQEAKWAMRWELYPEAQAAAETSWALGRHNPETARLRICAYSQSIPLQSPVSNHLPDTIFQKQILVLAIPDRHQFRLLIRAMDLFCQDAPYVLGGTNKPDPTGFLIGLQLVRRAAGLLESYYYAAELRANNREQLFDLRGKMRLMLSGGKYSRQNRVNIFFFLRISALHSRICLRYTGKDWIEAIIPSQTANDRIPSAISLAFSLKGFDAVNCHSN